MSDNKTVWQTLNDIDVDKYIKKKANLDYLPWSSAMGLVKPYYPDASYKVYKNDLGWNYHTDGSTCWVEVGVTIENIEAIEYLPVMDYKNKSIPKEHVTSVDINKAIKRATVKALAQHGLAISLYTGEELPSETQDEVKRKSYNTWSKANELDKKNYKIEFMGLCADSEVDKEDIKDFLSFVSPGMDEKETHNQIVHFLRQPELLSDQLESYKSYVIKQASA